MNITVFGATGKVGSLVTKEALARGHQVTAFSFRGSPNIKSNSLRLVKGDVRKPDDVLQAIRNADAVISALGSWGTPTKDILSAGMSNIIPAMEGRNVTRIVSLTGADAHDSNDKPGFINKLSHSMLGVIAKPILEDGEKHIALLRKSSLNWTVVRSPVMTDGKPEQGYILLPDLISPFRTIPRTLVAKCLVDLAESGEYQKMCPVIVRAR